MSLSTVATVTLEMSACWSLGWATHMFIKGHNSLLPKWRWNKWTYNHCSNQTFSMNYTITLQIPIKDANVPQYVIIRPLPLLESTQQVQSKDVFPGLSSKFKAVVAVFVERLSWSRPKMGQSCGDQVINVTRRSLQWQWEIRVVLLNLRQSEDVIRIAFLTMWKDYTLKREGSQRKLEVVQFSLASWRLRTSPSPNPGSLRGSLGLVPLPFLWSQQVWPGTKSFCVRGSCAMLSPWTKSTLCTPVNLQQNNNNKRWGASKSTMRSCFIHVKGKFYEIRLSERTDFERECCRPGCEPSASLLSVCRCQCRLCRGPECS